MSKVSFDGSDKSITILSSYSNISVKEDIYSVWKEWSIIPSNMMFLPAMRSIGGDPIGAGKFAGDIYFLINGWRIVVDHPVEVTGVIYHDDNMDVFDILPSGSVINVVSSIVQTVSTSGSSINIADIAESVRIEMDANSQKLLQTIEKLNKTIEKIEETQAFVLSA